MYVSVPIKTIIGLRTRNSVIVTRSSIYHYRRQQLNKMVFKGKCIIIWTICSKISTFSSGTCIKVVLVYCLNLLMTWTNWNCCCKVWYTRCSIVKNTKAVFKIEVSIAAYVWYMYSVNTILFWVCTTCPRKKNVRWIIKNNSNLSFICD